MDIDQDEFTCCKDGCSEKIKRGDISPFGHFLISKGCGVFCIEHDRQEAMSKEDLLKYDELWEEFVKWCAED